MTLDCLGLIDYHIWQAEKCQMLNHLGARHPDALKQAYLAGQELVGPTLA